MDSGCQRCGAYCQVVDPIDIYPNDLDLLLSPESRLQNAEKLEKALSKMMQFE